MTTSRQAGVVHHAVPENNDGSLRETLQTTEQQRFLLCQQSQQHLLVLRNKKEETGSIVWKMRNHIWLWCLSMAYCFQQIWRQTCVSLTTHHHHWNVESSFQQSLVVEEAVVVVVPTTTTGDTAVGGSDHRLQNEWKQPSPIIIRGILRESKHGKPKRNHRKQPFRSLLHHVPRRSSKRKLLILSSSSSSLDDGDTIPTTTDANNDTGMNKKRVTFAAGFVTSIMIITNNNNHNDKPTRNRSKRNDSHRFASAESLGSQHTFQP